MGEECNDGIKKEYLKKGEQIKAISENLEAVDDSNLPEVKETLREAIFQLEALFRELHDCNVEIGGRLDEIGKLIESLEKQFPDDKDLQLIKSLYLDIKFDFEDSQPLDIDTSAEKWMGIINNDIAASDITMEDPDHTALASQVQRLRDLGIEPSYVVNSGVPGAPTVVLVMQVHHYPSGELDSGAAYSQGEIYNYLVAAVDNSLTRTVFVEGLNPQGFDFLLDKKGEKKSKGWAHKYFYRLMKADEGLAGKIKFEPLENAYRHRDADPRHTGKIGKYRSTFDNLFIAEQVAGTLQKDISSDEMPFVVLGAAHEQITTEDDRDFLSVSDEITGLHRFPVSRALALNGLNVVVVDTTQEERRAHIKVDTLIKEGKKLEQQLAKLKIEYDRLTKLSEELSQKFGALSPSETGEKIEILDSMKDTNTKMLDKGSEILRIYDKLSANKQAISLEYRELLKPLKPEDF